MQMKNITVERVPLPYGVGSKTGRGALSPWRELQVGDSFFLPNRNQQSTKYWSRQTGWSFTTRKVRENDVVGIRVWRTK
jgi:hypothetical protein